MRRDMPNRVAIYFHELEAHQRPAFRDAIRALKDLGHRTVGPEEYLAAKPGEKLLFVSFDDNYRSWHEARAVLDETGIRATFYTNTLPFRDRCDAAELARYFDRIAFRGNRVTLSTLELKELVRDGHTIGCHSHTHYRVSDLSVDQWDAEIRQSKRILEDLTGMEIANFAFPYGMRPCFSPALHDYCRSIGFRTIAAAIPAMLHVGVEAGDYIHRSGWRFGESLATNLIDLAVDGRHFERWTGRSAIG
jgi:peptidoglycan/xylan/chitin deacetylase (PgdA/CDA1 family)